MRTQTVAPVVLLCALAAGVVSLQIVRDHRTQTTEGIEQLLYVRSPAVATRLALSYKAALADVYWIRVVQYYGATRLSKAPTRNYDLLYPLLELTTSLDPQFSAAYRFGAFFLSETPPGGPGRVDLARQLLDKAMASDPKRWEYPYDVGFLYYRSGDYPRAADWFKRASAVKGAPEWLQPMAAVTLAAGGETTASRLLWRQLLTADQAWLRKSAEFRLQQLDMMDLVKALKRVVAEYERTHGRKPADWNELIRAGVLRGVPRDTAGYPLLLDGATGVVTLSDASPLSPLPTEKAP